MLINFAFSNYKSFKDEQVFSMEKDTSVDFEKDPLMHTEGEPGLSCTAAIYGANAAGKSNFLQAFIDLSYLLIKNYQDNAHTGFAGDKSTPTTFEVTFIGKNKVKYNYSLDITTNGVSFERLSIYKTFQPTTIYEWTAGDKPKLNEQFFTEEERTAIAYNATTKSTTVFFQLSGVENSDIKNAYEFFAQNIFVHINIDPGKQGNNALISQVIQEQPEVHKLLNTLLPAADLGIQGIDLIEKETGSNAKQDEILTNAIVEYAKAADEKLSDAEIDRIKEALTKKIFDTVFQHRIGSKLINFGIEQESDGTIAASGIFIDLLPVLSRGAVYLVDELDRSLHPTIVAQIIEIFSHRETNPHGAQLIFTTHDTSLLDSSIYDKKLLDRDEVWFVEKNSAGESEIYPLTSIKYTTTKASNPYKKYIEGRYGAIPRVSLTSAIESYWKDQDA